MDQEQGKGSGGPGTPVYLDDSDENPDSYNKMKFHASKMDLNLRILRDQMTNLRDSGDSISRQMASMYRNFQKVKDEDSVIDDGESGDDSGDERMRDRSCVDTEDDVNQMTDLDADESSISSRKGPLPQGQLANLQRKKAAQNGREPPGRNANNRGRAQNNQRGQANARQTGNAKSRDSNANDVSSDITTTTTRNPDIPLSGMDGDAEDEDDTMSESECSGNCLCCSSIASYQGIPWTIRRPSSAETTEYDSDSSECSDYEDDRYRSKRAPLHARLSPFFHQECSHSESSSPVEDDDEIKGAQIPVKRMSPLGCESPGKTDAPPPEASKDSKPKSSAKGATSGPPKPAPKPANKPPKATGSKQLSPEEPSKPKTQEKKERKKKQEVSLSEAVALGAVARSEKPAGPTSSRKKSEDGAESGKSKTSHVSKTAIVLLDPEAEFKDGDTIKKRSSILPPQQAIEVPLSYVDKNGRITLTPDPKLAPEAYKAGKTITFRVRAASDNISTNPDGSMVFTPTSGSKPVFDSPPTVRAPAPKTILRVGSTESPPVSIAAEEIGHEHQIQVSPDGIIRLSKRKPVPMQVFLPQFQQATQHQQQHQQGATIRVAGGAPEAEATHESCPNCHKRSSTSVVQQVQAVPSSSAASNVRVVRMSPGITASPVQPSPPQQSRVQVIQRQNSGLGSPPTERQQIIVQQGGHVVPQQRHGQQIIIKRQDSGNLQFQLGQQQQQQHQQQQVVYPQQVYQQGGYPQQVQHQQGYAQQGYQQVLQPSSGAIHVGDTISIPMQQGPQSYQRQVIHQSGPPPQVQQQQMPAAPGGSGVTTIRFGDGAPIKVTPGQGMKFIINPK